MVDRIEEKDLAKSTDAVHTGVGYVIGVDIERTGVFSENATIGIGMSLVDQDCREIDSLFLAGYVEGEAKFEQRSYDEFWSKNLDNLKKLTYHGKLSYADRQREMIVMFQQFRAKYPDAMLVTDNNLFDVAYINQMIERWTSDLPIPYKGTQYNNCWETHSMQKGFLLALGDAAGNESWGFSKRMQELFILPPMTREYSHNPVDDAYSIAYDMQVMLGVSSGRFKSKGTCPLTNPDKK